MLPQKTTKETEKSDLTVKAYTAIRQMLFIMRFTPAKKLNIKTLTTVSV